MKTIQSEQRPAVGVVSLSILLSATVVHLSHYFGRRPEVTKLAVYNS